MNSGYGTSAYFSSENDARRAAEDLRAQGCEVDVHTQGTHGQNFWDAIKNFFSGQSDSDRSDNDRSGYEQYGSGTIVVISGGDPQTVLTIVQQYNGDVRGGDMSSSTTGSAGSSTTGSTTPGDTSLTNSTGMSSGTSSSVTGTAGPDTGGVLENDTEYQRTRTGGVAGTGSTGMSSTTGDMPNLD